VSAIPFALLERDLLPDGLIRFGIRRLLAARLRGEDKGDPEDQQAHFMRCRARSSASCSART
jgi:cyclopropane-fatty-acyl-phospholipid synthase